jgi:shikimate kinase
MNSQENTKKERGTCMYKNVVLVGFMGTGKTSVGKILAKKMGWVFADTDHYVEEKAGAAIPQIFEAEGEQAFRLMETEALREILAGECHVVSTGGGAVLKEENRKLMLAGGLVVALTASEATIVERVRYDVNRPLLKGNVEEKVHILMEARRAAYTFAPLQIDTDIMSAEQIARLIEERLKGPA